ncbi:DNA-binding NarL/FixJ family response regulator [Diaminobutyricimonas aerilata]|uniref:DNA-binding NarL/FixJ family response regulator n=1 Tax=Diaminobutyricimonas aerilata TaxID=1162967 RepID=A0A2M9CN61_9MICO|nr:response regulator transcription factor [Diaminobutyricimonas aerilata]PJJ73331.1 DNA-binding NarL/FixJ family response regulator [Diaminobutyricimonas aerilata]
MSGAVIRLAIVDDEALVRGGLRAILAVEPDLEIVGEAADGDEVPALVASTRPDVVLMDVRMPRIDGLRATETLLRAGADAPRVLVLTTFESDDYVYEALRIGASGFVLKRAQPEELARAIRVVAHDDVLLYPVAVRRLAALRGPAPAAERLSARLSGREQEVLRLVAQGLSNAEIAARLFLALETVKSHVAAILVKLGVRDRTQAVVAAYESGFIRPGAE